MFRRFGVCDSDSELGDYQKMGKENPKTSIVFHINGEEHRVNAGSNLGANTTLVDYIRDVANLKGTKVMCREGGCGACIVTVKVIDPATGKEIIKSVNSCLTPVMSCDGWDISTIERLGNKHEGYHVIQNRLVSFNGTQCGYCSPGMTMNMYSQLESNKNLEMEDVEKNLDGNICRCTGYRPILEAFKSLAKDAPADLMKKCADIEDCTRCPLRKENSPCKNGIAKESESNFVKLASGEDWVSAKSIECALRTAAQYMVNNGGAGMPIRFVGGNTSSGIFKNEGPFKAFIDINGIPDLRRTSIDNEGITLGGATTLTEAIHLCREASKNTGLEYTAKIAKHLERVANVSVRNNGTLAGNLMIKHRNPNFPSDIFVLLESIGATLTIVSFRAKKFLGKLEKAVLEDMKPIGVMEFLGINMDLKLIKSIHLPKLVGYHFRSFKITRRYQNAHAYVNAAFLFKVNPNDGYVVEGKPSIVYGGIAPSFVHATATENILQGKSLLDETKLCEVLQTLENEVKCETGPLESSPFYRVQLTKALLYKTILEIIGDNASEQIRSGARDLSRNLSKAKISVDQDINDTALYKYVPKYEGGIQASGEAEFTGDIPYRPDELFAAFVTSTVACADIINIDASEALKIPGVVKFISAKDIPGENNAVKYNMFPVQFPEPVFASDKTYYYGQALGLILATKRDIAASAAKLVNITYANERKPVVKIVDAIEKAKDEGKLPMQTIGFYSTKPNEDIKVVHTVGGKIECGSQYHFHMESQSVVCIPREDGIDVHSSTQWMDHVQSTVASVLGIPNNSVNVQVRRVGGGFGGKISRPSWVASACAVGCWVTKRPVRMVMDLESNMTMLGRRCPFYIPYEVGFDEEGKIGSLKIDFTCDTGYAPNEATVILALMHVQNVYKSIGWEVNTHFVTTDTATTTFTRAPGSVKGVATIECIMDHIAHYLKKDPVEVREVNLMETGDSLLFGAPTYERTNLIPLMIKQMKEESQYESRRAEIDQFNKEHRWKKRGLSVVPVRYGIDYWGTNWPTSIAIYHTDGTVAVSHGGIEMGQGINTKAIQTVAQALGVPIDNIKIKPTNNFVGANATVTGGSISSELVCYSLTRACEEIRENLRPILEKLENPSWEKLIEEAHTAKVKLTASYTPTGKDELKGYDVWVLAVNEVEIDVLTGEYKVCRTDLYEDTGKSLSPGVDLGQIEGAYIFGQGYWTTEKFVYDENTGQLLTNGTWDYKVPEARDIPEDFRISLLSNAPTPNGVLRSKATGEPSTDAAYGVVLALRNAIASARADAGYTEWFDIAGPLTPEDVALLCLTNVTHLKL